MHLWFRNLQICLCHIIVRWQKHIFVIFNQVFCIYKTSVLFHKPIKQENVSSVFIDAMCKDMLRMRGHVISYHVFETFSDKDCLNLTLEYISF